MDSAEDYVESLYPRDPDLERVRDSIRGLGQPDISVPFAYGRLLQMLAASCGAKMALEIGAFGGYSGICLARGLRPGGKLISLELQEEYIEMAKSHLDMAGLLEYVEFRRGHALDSLREMERNRMRFDFFFIDADKGNYPEYLEACIRLANPGAWIAGDNAFMHGRTYADERDGPSIRAMRIFNERLASDPRLESTILPAYDGLALARVKA